MSGAINFIGTYSIKAMLSMCAARGASTLLRALKSAKWRRRRKVRTGGRMAKRVRW
jgi:hypothetical protein